MARSALCALGMTALVSFGAIGCSDGETATTSPPAANQAPVFTSADSAQASDGASGAVYTAMATDADGDSITFSISGGDDQGAFAIDAASGALSFATAPDVSAPADADGDNVYLVELTASDGVDDATLALQITVVAGAASMRRIAMGLEAPMFVIDVGDGTGRLFVGERGGQIEILHADRDDPLFGLVGDQPFLDIEDAVNTQGERGLLGMALAPDFATSGVFYVHVSNNEGDTEVRRYAGDPDNPTPLNPPIDELVLRVAQPEDNHNGGSIAFSPDDGFLYIATGDGGGGGDPFGNGQDLSTLLGAILRIDVSGADDFPSDDTRNYAIPGDNPFVATAGAAPEIWAYGLRNPFRASFDGATGDFYIGDVGQGAIEEVDLIPAGVGGLNFGWNVLEGTAPFDGVDDGVSFTPPIAEYDHGFGPTEGNSVTGGVVYRGAVTSLRDSYVFGDFVSNNLWSIPLADIQQGSTLSGGDFTLQTEAFTPDAGAIDSVVSFDLDDAGDLYVVDIDGEIFRLEASLDQEADPATGG